MTASERHTDILALSLAAILGILVSSANCSSLLHSKYLSRPIRQFEGSIASGSTGPDPNAGDFSEFPTSVDGSRFPKKELPPPEPQNPAQQKMADSSLEFTWDAYRGLEIPSNQNVFFSPYSIMNALGMLTMGTVGNARSQLKEAMHVNPNLPENTLHQGLSFENSKLVQETSATFTVANKFFVDLTMSNNINPEFLRNLSDYYNSSMQAINFGTDTRGAVRIINKWVSENTKGKITDLVPPNLDPNTQLILANAIYFNGTWNFPFNPKLSASGNFQTSVPEKSVVVQYMYLNSNLLYARDNVLGVETVVLPYTDSKYAMHIILPDPERSLADIESDLNANQVQKLASRTKISPVILKMPKFSLRQKMSLADLLFKLNATDVFTPLKNDFSNIFLSSRTGFFVNDVLHEAMVEVDEKGTVAAAATAVVAIRTAFPTKFVTVDRPFIFYISDESNGFILFWGRVENPTK